MNTRLQQFLAAENISQAEFADTIKVARASVSHIIAGRNKPGYEFISNMIKYYPNLNIEWLISGKGKMYKKDGAGLFPEERQGHDGSSVPGTAASAEPSTLQDSGISAYDGTDHANIEATETSQPVQDMVQKTERQRKAVKIMVFYDDNTFQEFQK